MPLVVYLRALRVNPRFRLSACNTRDSADNPSQRQLAGMRDEDLAFFRRSVIPPLEQCQVVGDLSALTLSSSDLGEGFSHTRLQCLRLQFWCNFCLGALERHRFRDMRMREQRARARAQIWMLHAFDVELRRSAQQAITIFEQRHMIFKCRALDNDRAKLVNSAYDLGHA